MNFNFKHLIFLTTLILISSSTFANFKKLAYEYLENNIGLEKQKLNIEIESYNYNIVKAKTSFLLSLDSSYDKNEKAQPSILSPSYKTESHSLGISKEFSFGGNLSFTQNYTKKTLLSQTSSFFQSKPYTMESSIIYSQDIGKNFFGRDFRKDLEIKAQRTFLQKVAYDVKVENDLFTFTSYFLAGKTAKKLILLQQEAIKRAIQRKNIIEKRVKDGLLDEVDLLEVTQLLMKQQEAEQLNVENLNLILSNLSTMVHRKVSIDEISILDIDQKLEVPDIDLNSGPNLNKDLELIVSNIETVKKEIEKVNFGLAPEISLYTGLKTNQIGDDQTTTFNDSLPGNPKKEIVVGIKATYPIGQYAVRAQREQLRIKLISYESELIKTENNIHELKNKSLTEMDLLQSLIDSTIKRRVISQKSLKLQNRLYDLGKKDIELLIKAEENLIDVEKNLADYVSKFEKEKLEFIHLNGKLSSYIFDQETIL